MSRTPPRSGTTGYREPVLILVFSKEGTTVYSRLIRRVPVRLALREGGTIDAVRYDRRYWPTYKPETFPEQSKDWLNDGDTLYGPDQKPLKLPLTERFMFEGDQHRGGYDW